MTTAARFAGRTALVTGGASGIGAATVRALAAEGARVAVLDLNQAAGQDLANEIGGLFVRCDVTDPGQWDVAMRTVRHELGGLDLVYLNAGIMTRPPSVTLRSDIFDWIDSGDYRRIVAINIDGVVFGLRAVVPVLESRGGGSIVATASIAGLLAFPPDPFYTMTKHAVVGLVRSFAPLLQAKEIRINAICPGGVDTPLIPDALRGGNLGLMPPAALAAAVLDLFESPGTGEAWVKANAAAPAYRYDVPGIVTP